VVPTKTKSNKPYLLIKTTKQMKTKLLTLLTLLLFVCSGAWAADATITLGGRTAKDSKTTALVPTISTSNAIITTGTVASTCATDGYIVSTTDGKTIIFNETTYYLSQPYQSGSKKYWKDAGANFYGTFTIPNGYIYTVKSISHALAAQGSSNFKATISIKENSTAKYTSNEISVTKYSDGATATATSIEISETNWITLSAGTYTINVTPTCTDSSTGKYFGIAQVVVSGSLASSTPTLTGAWMLSDTDVTGETANVVQGSASPTLPTFTVGASSGTPTAADNYNVAYSLKEGSTEGVFTFTDDVPTTISTTTAGSATVVATLTTKDATAFLEPETNTFEYTVSVSAASAPTINVTGAPDGDILVGTEVTLTAEATGVPTPTVTWYDNETNESVGTGDTYVVNTATAGTYSYYAVASNGIGDDATSEVQTIVVKEQVLTPTFTPNGSYFETSQSVTLACETDGATIKYSTDNGETWTAYSEAFSITATTTVKAKAVKDGYFDSEVASATFNKVTLVEQIDVTGATTWNWNDITSGEVNLAGSNIARTDVVFANIPQYGFTITAPDAFNQQALVINADYAVRSVKISNTNYKYMQGTTVKFRTTVPGTLSVDFSNTGSDRPYRYLYMNGESTGFKSNVSSAITNATGISVPAGEVVLTGVLDPESSDSGAGQVNFLRIFKIVFTPCETINVAASGWTSLASVLDLDIANATTTTEGADALKAYVISNITKTAVTLTAVESAPAETGLILKGKASTAYTIPVSESPASIAKNELSAAVTATAVEAESVYVVSGGELKLYTGTEIPAGKAYLEAEKVPTGARGLSFVFDDGETTGISNIEDSQRQLLIGDFFNLAGQRVAAPAKGLYIVNGKKVVLK